MSPALDRVEATAWLCTAALSASVALRLLTVLAAEAVGSAVDRDAAPSASAVGAPRSGMRAEQKRQEQILGLASDDAGVRVPGTSSAQALIYPQLYVNAGPPRSAVFVNGVRVGQTPFIGEVGCRTGDLVKVDVDPPSGAPLRFSGRCAGSTLSVKKDE